MAGSMFLGPAPHQTCSRLGSRHGQRLLVSPHLHIPGAGWHSVMLQPPVSPSSPPHASTNLVLSVPINPASLSPLVTSPFLTHPTSSLFPTHHLPLVMRQEQWRRRREKGLYHPYHLQFSPQENLALKVLASQETLPYPPDLIGRCSFLHLPACFPKGQVDLQENHLPATINSSIQLHQQSRV